MSVSSSATAHAVQIIAMPLKSTLFTLFSQNVKNGKKIQIPLGKGGLFGYVYGNNYIIV